MNRSPLLLFLCLSLVAADALANPDRAANREREMLRRAQQQVQSLQGQLTTLEQEAGALRKQAQQAADETRGLRNRLGRAQRELRQEQEAHAASRDELTRATADLSALRPLLAETEARLAETRADLAQTRDTLARTQAERARLDGLRQQLEREYAACEQRNVALYGIGRELMVRFEQKTCGEILAQKEPFLGLRRVEVENLLERYRDRLDEQQLLKPPAR